VVGKAEKSRQTTVKYPSNVSSRLEGGLDGPGLSKEDFQRVGGMCPDLSGRPWSNPESPRPSIVSTARPG